MSPVHRKPAAAALLLTLVMAGCGGGGGGGSPTSAAPSGTTTPVDTPAPTPPASGTPGTPAPAPSSPTGQVGCAAGDSPTVRASAFSLLNVVRTAAGLPGFVRMAVLDGTAQAHAQYVAANGSGGSEEIPGQPCYTGADYAARLASAGVATVDVSGARSRSESVLSYVMSGSGDPASWDMVNDLLNNLYGRLLLLDPHTQQLGIGFSALPDGPRRAMVVDTALTAGSAGAGSGVWAVWPRDGATGLPVQMRASNLKPLPDGVTEGFPVSLHAGDEVQISRFVMADAATGTPVQATLVTAANDRNLLMGRGEAALVPEAPLAPGTTYRVELDGLVASQPMHMTWSFATAP